MTIDMHPPANHRCQIYSETTSVRCINTGTHWVSWGKCQHLGSAHDDDACEAEFFSWECDGPHRFGEASAATAPPQREAA